MNRVRSTIVAILCIIFVLVNPIFGQSIPPKGLESITAPEMKNHVIYLASDQMRGRDTPSPELDSCASYIAGAFDSYGLLPVSEDTLFYQHFNLLQARLSEPNTLSILGEEETGYVLKDDFVPLHTTANGSVTAPLVFAGYGITAPEYGYDDYDGIDAEGSTVLIFTGEPHEKNSSDVFEGLSNTEHAKIHNKVQNAIDHGAVGLLLVSSPIRRFRRPPNPWPSLMRHAIANAVPLTLESRRGKRIVCVRIGKQLADDIIAGSGHSIESLHSAIDSTLNPQSFKIVGKNISMETQLTADQIPTQNVVGLWEGSDPVLKEEVVIIGAHYDHVGVRNDTLIFNGADDNASGTAGVMEIAQAFSESTHRPKRSVLFITFAGEEKGLFGSRFYTDSPLFPSSRTVAMLNMDMISRNAPDSVGIIGAETSTFLKDANEKANENIGMKMEYGPDEYFMRSDHYPFYQEGIPVLFYFTGPTPDYHQPTDDPDKVLPEKMARIARLVFSTAWIVADSKETIDFKRVQ